MGIASACYRVGSVVGGLLTVAVLCAALLALLSPRHPQAPPKVIVQPKPVDRVLIAVEAELASKLVGVGPGEAAIVAETLVSEARLVGFDPWFVVAVIEVESRFAVEACSPSGARGLMQLLPSTFHMLSSHYRVMDPVENVRVGIAYLWQLYSKNGFKRIESVLRAYNGGPGAAGEYGRAMRAGSDMSDFPREMIEYPGLVLEKYRRLLKAAGGDYRHPEKAWRVTK